MRIRDQRAGIETGAVGPTRRSVLLGAAATLAAPALMTRARAAPQKKLGVVEMFTSQGCSSCPPADDVLAELIANNEAIGLAHHVDYWDYLGWKDTLGSREATRRQYAYASAFGRRGVYTPQAVVNGRSHHVGSRGREVRVTLAEQARAGHAPTLDLLLERTGQKGSVTIDGPSSQSADVMLFHFASKHTEAIERGENHGRTITYHHPVLGFRGIGGWNGGEARIEFDMPEAAADDGVAILVHQRLSSGAPGPVLGAASMVLSIV